MEAGGGEGLQIIEALASLFLTQGNAKLKTYTHTSRPQNITLIIREYPNVRVSEI